MSIRLFSIAAIDRSRSSVIAALGGTSYTGETGSTSVTLPAGQKPYSASNQTTGLTVDKLLEAKKILDLADVDPSLPRFIVVSPKQISDLLNTTEVKSSDFNTVKALAQGQLDSFLGFKFIVSNRLKFDATNTDDRLAYAFTADAVSEAHQSASAT